MPQRSRHSREAVCRLQVGELPQQQQQQLAVEEGRCTEGIFVPILTVPPQRQHRSLRQQEEEEEEVGRPRRTSAFGITITRLLWMSCFLSRG